MYVEIFAKTNVGRVRSGNEDNFLVLDLSTSKAWTGTEGDMPTGGDEGDGETACGPDAPLVECLKNATDYANFAIHRKSQEDPRCSGMGATLTAAAITKDGVSLLQVGDSRGYVLRGERIKLATKDQSLVQQLVDVGQISEEEAETHMFRNVILQALGAQPDLAPATASVRVFRGDLLLLCSDGLSGKLRGDDIRHIVTSSNGDLARACEALVAEANDRGGEDNITVVLARLAGEDLPSPDTDRITVELPPPDGDDTIGHEDGDPTEPL